MSNSPRMRFLTVCIGAALAQMATLPALADSGVGADTVIGNAMNPGYPAGPAQLDADVPYVKRTPSGQMYEFPTAREAEAGDGKLTGSVEFGYLYADDRKGYSKRKEYTDQQNDGLYLNNFDLSTETVGAYFFNINGGGLGQDDQFYNLSAGQYGRWKVKAFYNETPHVFSTTFRPLYIDNGSGRPTLNNGAAGAATTAAAVNAYLATQPLTEVGLMRKKGGMRVDVNLIDNLKGYASFSQEKRDGARPFGFQDGNSEGIEPIDHVTNDFLAGLQYSDGLTAANLSVSASFFNNEINTLFAPRALTAVNAAPTTLATQDAIAYSLAPDNEAYNIKGEVSRKLPDFYKGRISAAVAFGSSRQNDAIRMPLDPAASASMLAAAGQAAQNAANGAVVFNKDNWNGVNGSPLSRTTSGQRIDTELFNLGLNLNPLDDLSVKGNYRHFATKNKSGTYYAYNPLTGQWSSGIEQTTGTNFMVGLGCNPAPGFTVSPLCAPGGVTRNFPANPRSVSAPPRDYKQDIFTLSGDYDLGNGSLEGSLEREDFSHTFRERDKTWEDKVKLGYVNTSFDQATLRASFEDNRKRGSFYDPLVAERLNAGFVIQGTQYSRALLESMIANAGVGTNPTIAQLQAYVIAATSNDPRMQKTDQADRDQQIFNARLNYLAREDLDIGAMMQVKQVRYPGNAIAGVQKEDLNTYNIDVNYQPSAEMQLSAYYTRQDGKSRTVENYGTSGGQANITPICGAVLTVANLNCYMNNVRLNTSDVLVDTSDTNDTLGFGYQQGIGQMTLGIDYSYTLGRTSITHAYGPTALTAANLAALAGIGNIGYPDMATQQNALTVNLLVPIDKQLSARLMYSYEDFKVKDWHYDYFTTAQIYNDLGPLNYRVNTVGVLLNFKM